MQIAAYVGLRLRGVSGATVSYIGFGVPAFFIMMVLSALYFKTYSLPLAISAFRGLQAIIVAIVAFAAFSFGKSYMKLRRDAILAALAAGVFTLGISPILVILLAGIGGLMIYRDQRPEQKPVDIGETPYTSRALLFILTAVVAAFALLFFLRGDLFELAALMFRRDLFAFGGGFSSIALMLHEFVDVRSWMDAQTFLNGIALGQITPGPIVITATFIGYMMYGPIGGLVATTSIFLPSFLLVVGTVPYYDQLSSSIRFSRAINGIFCSFVGLLAYVTLHLAYNVPWDLPRVLLAGSAFVALQKKIDILWIVGLGTVISILTL
jgi:chromate transporter